MKKILIPVYRPSLQGNEKKYVDECLKSTWISSKGRFLPLFEQEFAQRIGVKYSASVCNGTVALHLAMLALGIGPGDEVIVPTLTYISCANSIAYCGATPVFVDSLYDSWQMDPKDVQKKISRKTKAVLAVHLYGHPCEMHELTAICRKNGLFLVEDCAEAFGSLYKGHHVGTFGDISTFSFFGNKTITTGEGGMVVTDKAALIKNVIHFKGQGLAKGREYWHDVIGYNYRMTNICAAIGLAQLEKASLKIRKKREIAKWYKNELEGTPIECHSESPIVQHSYWMNSILAPNGKKKEQIRKHLRKHGVDTRPLFFPIHGMPMYRQKGQNFPVAEDLALRGINLPSYPDLTRRQIKYVCRLIKEAL